MSVKKRLWLGAVLVAVALVVVPVGAAYGESVPGDTVFPSAELDDGESAQPDTATAPSRSTRAATAWGSSSWEITGTVLHLGAGTLPAVDLNKVPWAASAAKLTKVVFDDPAHTSFGTTTRYLFYNLVNVTDIEGIGLVNTSNVTDMGAMFYNARSLTSLDLSGWDVSKVISIGTMFAGTSKLSTLNVSGWDTRSVTHMDNVFNGASALTRVDISGWNTSQVITFGSMFKGASALVTLGGPVRLEYRQRDDHGQHVQWCPCVDTS